MSRSGYSEECDRWALICWRGAVASSLRGVRGQRLLTDLRDALKAMPVKELIANELEADGKYCALGIVGCARKIDMQGVNVEDSEEVARMFDISNAMAKEIVYMNDEYYYYPETNESRHARMLAWVETKISPAAT